MSQRRAFFLFALAALAPLSGLHAQTRLLRQPTVAGDQIAFAYAGDLWLTTRAGGAARRLTATPAVESDPHFSPDGKRIAFTSNRDGIPAVYVMPVEGGDMKRLTWYPANALARGWTPDGRRVLYATNRETAPVGHDRLWTVSAEGGPSTVLPAPFGHRASYSPDGKRLIVDRTSRWDVEWRNYRGGQNTALTILDLAGLDEVLLPNERTSDIAPVWLGNTIYFISDRNRAANLWAYDVGSKALRQLTQFANADVKSLSGRDNTLVFEQDGFLHTLDAASGRSQRINVTVTGDFPWATARWVDAARGFIATAALSPTGKRALMEARGEVFTIPVEKGDARNLTRSAGAADHAPVWSPNGTQVAWFSDDGTGYQLKIAAQDGSGETRTIGIGDSKYAWNSAWSPDGKLIAFVDHLARIRIVDVAAGTISTADVDGNTNNRGGMGLVWSGDSRWLAYSRSFPNMLRRIVVWNVERKQAQPITDALADARTPAWDRAVRHLYFLASTDVGLTAGWANTSSINVAPTFAPYIAILRNDDPTPFLRRAMRKRLHPRGRIPRRVQFASISRGSISASSHCRVCLSAVTRRCWRVRAESCSSVRALRISRA
jgi:tricorn protease